MKGTINPNFIFLQHEIFIYITALPVGKLDVILLIFFPNVNMSKPKGN